MMKKLLIPLCVGVSLMAGMSADPLRTLFLADRLEWQSGDHNPMVWDIAAYIGFDRNKLYLYSEGSRQKDETESENELLLSHAISPFWDLQAGIEVDRSGIDGQSWGVLSLQGLAPYFIDTRLRLKLADEAIGVVIDFEYEALLTQQLILTPRIEADWYSDEVPRIGVGSGLASMTMGLRLRYEIRREFAPYIGVEYSDGYGETSRRYGVKEESRFVAGVRFWF